MKNRAFVLSFFLLALLVASCSYDEGLVPGNEIPLDSKEDATLKGSKKHAVPFKSTFECWSVDFYQDADNPAMWHQIVEGTGKATHMGKTTVSIPDELLFPDDAWYNWTATADVILTAANGDELHFSYASSFAYDLPIHVIGTGPITGGTGRFEAATGWMTYEGLWPDETGKVTFTGKIKY